MPREKSPNSQRKDKLYSSLCALQFCLVLPDKLTIHSSCPNWEPNSGDLILVFHNALKHAGQENFCHSPTILITTSVTKSIWVPMKHTQIQSKNKVLQSKRFDYIQLIGIKRWISISKYLFLQMNKLLGAE